MSLSAFDQGLGSTRTPTPFPHNLREHTPHLLKPTLSHTTRCRPQCAESAGCLHLPPNSPTAAFLILALPTAHSPISEFLLQILPESSSPLFGYSISFPLFTLRAPKCSQQHLQGKATAVLLWSSEFPTFSTMVTDCLCDSHKAGRPPYRASSTAAFPPPFLSGALLPNQKLHLFSSGT